MESTTLIPHIRAATTGRRAAQNCHPFLIEDRLMAHNGGFGDLPAVEEHLGEYWRFLQGDTDSERYAALIAKFTDSNGGDAGDGIAGAAGWLSRHVPMYSLNTLVATPDSLWALRYPGARALHIAHRTVDPATGAAIHLTGRRTAGRHRISSTNPTRIVILASERIDESPDWRMLDEGELVHIGPDLGVTSRLVLTEPPARVLQISEPDPNEDGF